MTMYPFDKVLLTNALLAQGVSEEDIATVSYNPELSAKLAALIKELLETEQQTSLGTIYSPPEEVVIGNDVWPFALFISQPLAYFGPPLSKLTRLGTVGDLLERSEDEMGRLYRVATPTLWMIRVYLRELGLQLSTHPPGQPGFVRFVNHSGIGHRWVHWDRALQKSIRALDWSLYDRRIQYEFIEEAGMRKVIDLLAHANSIDFKRLLAVKLERSRHSSGVEPPIIEVYIEAVHNQYRMVSACRPQQ